MILLVIFNQGPVKNKPLFLIYYIPFITPCIKVDCNFYNYNEIGRANYLLY